MQIKPASFIRQAIPALVVGALLLGASFVPLVPNFSADPVSAQGPSSTPPAAGARGSAPTFTPTPNPSLGTLYGTNPTLSLLLEINTTTGAGVPKPNQIEGGRGFPALAVDPQTGIIYAGSGRSGEIFTVDATTGIGTLVGPIGLGASIHALDFRADGTLFASINTTSGGGGNTLATIDKSTGAATVVGPFGGFGFEAIGFAPDGTLYAVTRQNVSLVQGQQRSPGNVATRGLSPGLYTVDTTKGTATFVASLLLDGIGSIGIVSIQFDCKGTLYGGTVRQELGVLNGNGGLGARAAVFGGRLVTINPATGVVTFVGNAIAAANAPLGALATRNQCSQPPTVTSTPTKTATVTLTQTLAPSRTPGTPGRRTTPTRITIDTQPQPEQPTRTPGARTTPTFAVPTVTPTSTATGTKI